MFGRVSSLVLRLALQNPTPQFKGHSHAITPLAQQCHHGAGHRARVGFHGQRATLLADLRINHACRRWLRLHLELELRLLCSSASFLMPVRPVQSLQIQLHDFARLQMVPSILSRVLQHLRSLPLSPTQSCVRVPLRLYPNPGLLEKVLLKQILLLPRRRHLCWRMPPQAALHSRCVLELWGLLTPVRRLRRRSSTALPRRATRIRDFGQHSR